MGKTVEAHKSSAVKQGAKLPWFTALSKEQITEQQNKQQETEKGDKTNNP